jgi:Zn-dependent protease with chaperone function
LDFFGQQDRARRNSGRLVLLFVLAVLLLIAALYAVAVCVVAWQREMQVAGDPVLGEAWRRSEWWWQPDTLLAVSAVVVAVVGGGSLFKIAQLQDGGSGVALRLGGRLVDPGTSDPAERRLVNVVEEMALASGVPAPVVFVLDRETGINAFAAGWSPDDAALAVTRGALETLSRDELQGVIGHEFSHILNGDMRLNIRVMGVVHGILLLALLGRTMLRVVGHSRGGGDKGAQGKLAVGAVGLVLLIVGYVGWFMGQLIKAGISRQREFLADASAVQFTRDPMGLSGAMRKIRAAASGSRVESRGAEEASHFFFGNPLRGETWLQVMATHPPLDERIRRLDPSWDPERERAEAAAARAGAAPVERAAAEAASGFAGAAAPRRRNEPQAVVERVGVIDPAGRAEAAALLRSCPEALQEAIRQPFSCVALIQALLLDARPEVRRVQVKELSTFVDAAMLAETARLLQSVDAVPPAQRLLLADLAMPALRALSAPQLAELERALHLLVHADGRVDVFEFALEQVLRRRIAGLARPSRSHAQRVSGLRPLLPHAVLLLSVLAHQGHEDEGEAQLAFVAGARRLVGGAAERVALLHRDKVNLDAFGTALDHIARGAPAIRKQVLDAAAHCALADREVSVKEAELLRLVAIGLDCPMPPLA